MLEQALLREQFQELLSREQEAERAYAELAAKVTDPATLQKLNLLRRDKLRHIRLAQRLLEIVE
jgi:rubrerythrin